jgi:hypothetical protein
VQPKKGVRQRCSRSWEVRVYELLLTFGLLGVLGGVALGLHVLPVESVLLTGVWLMGAGLVVGLPASAVYHVLLRQSLLRREALPAGWYWNPTALHSLVPPHERRRVLAFCFVGAAGFVVIVLGCVAVALAAWRSA